MLPRPRSTPAEFVLGSLRVSPAERVIEGPGGMATLEPLAMQLLVELSRNAGAVVSRREIMELCWGSIPIGDDSLNRVVTVLRKRLDRAGQGTVRVETVPRTGYVLRLGLPLDGSPSGEQQTAQVIAAIAAAQSSIRLGLPEPDHLRLELLRQAVAHQPDNAIAWGLLALLSRHAAEYAPPANSTHHLFECEASARRAVALQPGQAEAMAALATVAPSFGRWLEVRSSLQAILQNSSDCFAASHELAIIEMATGYVGRAKQLVDGLLSADPLAACLSYKSIYQNWSTGDLVAMDHVGDRAIQLWPYHPAVWTARFWTLAYTGRVEAALAMLDDEIIPPPLPAPAARLFRCVAAAAASGKPAAIDEAAALSSAAANTGPAMAIAALFSLGLLRRGAAQLEVARAYYLRQGTAPVPVRHSDGEPSINDQHRRVTQILFTPAFAENRSAGDFGELCRRMGLTDHWDRVGRSPDFMAA